MFNVVFGPGYRPLNIYPGRLFTRFTNILRFPHSSTSAQPITYGGREIKLGKYCAPMNDTIRICLNFELSEVGLICHQFEESGRRKIWIFGKLPTSLLGWKMTQGAQLQSDKMRPVGIGNGSLKIPSILWTFSICGMGDNLKDLWRVMAAIYNFTQVPLTLPLQAAVKNRHGRRVISWGGEGGKRGFKKKGKWGEFWIYGDGNTVC